MRTQLLHFIASIINGTVAPSSAGTICLNGRAQVDSRLVQPGDLFFALPGEKVDGHDYIEAAAGRGAIAAVVSQEVQASLPTIQVPDTLLALQELAREELKQSHAKVIGITGSVGKTSTKEFIAQFLKRDYRVCSSPKSYNGQIGVPLSILSGDGTEEYYVLEMGMSQPNEMEQLLTIAQPDIGVVTAIDWVHSAPFASLDEIADEKSHVIRHAKTALIAGNCSHFAYLARVTSGKVLSYGMNGEDYSMECIKGGTYQVHKQGKKLGSVHFNLLGEHYAYNALAAIAIAFECGVPWKRIEEVAPQLQAPERRGIVSEYNGITWIDDTYNASRPSMVAALDSLEKYRSEGRRTVALLGEMAELGTHSPAIHKEVADYALSKVDILCCYGREWPLSDASASKEELTKKVSTLLSPGDVVLVKGSNCLQMWKMIDAIQGAK